MTDKREAYKCYDREQKEDSCGTCYWDRQEDNEELCNVCIKTAPVCGQDCQKCSWISIAEGLSDMSEQEKWEPEAQEIKIIYDDGTERSLQKGFVMEEKSRQGKMAELETTFLHISPVDLYMIVEALYITAEKLGLLIEQVKADAD